MELLLLTAALILLAVFFWSRRTNPNLPPFPCTPLPFVGHLFYLGDKPRDTFKKWRKQCGDMYSIYMGTSLAVVLNGFDLIKEAFVKNADVFSDRPPYFMDIATGLTEKGVAFSSGNNWKEQRSAAITILRKFGMGKNILAEKIQEEVTAYVNYLANQNGKPFDIRVMTNISASNVICSIIIGHRFDYDDKEFRRLIALLNSTALDQGNTSLFNFIPFLRYLPGDLFKAKKITGNILAVLNMLKSFIRDKKRDDVRPDDIDNFIDAYIVEKNKKIESGTRTNMNDDNLTKVINDLFGAGTETTSTTIYWCVLYMMTYPDIQEKVYREIKEVVGANRYPNMQDKCSLPYFNAVVLETQRLASIVPLSLTHMCSEDVVLRGKTIPKGTVIVPNLDSVLHDKKIWGEDAMTFKPERFLDSSGKFLDREELISFGIGRRICLGEALAKMELFLFLSNMFQRFQFLPKDATPPSCKEYVFGLACAPRPYEVRMVERK